MFEFIPDALDAYIVDSTYGGSIGGGHGSCTCDSNNVCVDDEDPCEDESEIFLDAGTNYVCAHVTGQGPAQNQGHDYSFTLRVGECGDSDSMTITICQSNICTGILEYGIISLHCYRCGDQSCTQ